LLPKSSNYFDDEDDISLNHHTLQTKLSTAVTYILSLEIREFAYLVILFSIIDDDILFRRKMLKMNTWLLLLTAAFLDPTVATTTTNSADTILQRFGISKIRVFHFLRPFLAPRLARCMSKLAALIFIVGQICRLDVTVHKFGESFYNEKIPPVIQEFEKAGNFEADDWCERERTSRKKASLLVDQLAAVLEGSDSRGIRLVGESNTMADICIVVALSKQALSNNTWPPSSGPNLLQRPRGSLGTRQRRLSRSIVYRLRSIS
jgi:hypothetical protein